MRIALDTTAYVAFKQNISAVVEHIVKAERILFSPVVLAELISICREERRCLVTMDLDFGNPLVFKPAEYYGIALLRLPPRPVPEDLDEAVKTLIGGLARDNIVKKLWIVQTGRIREYQST